MFNLWSFSMTLVLAWPSLLCQSCSWLDLLATRHTSWSASSFSWRTYIFLRHWAMNLVAFDSGLLIMHLSCSKVTIFPSSHNWLMLRRLCLSPSTSRTYSICVVPAKSTEPIPTALALEVSPKVTEPRSCLVTLLKSCSSPLICLEQSLSRIHSECGLLRLSCKIKESF